MSAGIQPIFSASKATPAINTKTAKPKFGLSLLAIFFLLILVATYDAY